MRRNIVGTRKYHTPPCVVRQTLVEKHKDQLLTALEKFFDESVTKTEFRSQLKTLKSNVQKTCQ